MITRSSRLLSCGHYRYCKSSNPPPSIWVKYSCFTTLLRISAVIQPNMPKAGNSLQNDHEELETPLMWPLSVLQVIKSSSINLGEIFLLHHLAQNQCSDPTKHAESWEQP